MFKFDAQYLDFSSMMPSKTYHTSYQRVFLRKICSVSGSKIKTEWMISEYSVTGIVKTLKSAWKCQIQRKELNNVTFVFQEHISWIFKSNVPNEWFDSQDALFMIAMDVKKEFYLEIESPLKTLDAKVVVCWELCEAYLINFTRLKRSLSFVYIVDKSSSKRSTELRENKNQINGNKFA